MFYVQPICVVDYPYYEYARPSLRFPGVVKARKIQTDPLPARAASGHTPPRHRGA